MPVSSVSALSARTLVDPAFFKRLSNRVATTNAIEQQLAEDITDQALAFLATAATKPAGTGSLSPSPTVDMAHHCFLEYTREYDEFFSSRGWSKVHHVPWDDPSKTYESSGVVIPRTIKAIRSAGYFIDLDLWDTENVSCGGDDSDGKPGDPPPCGDHG